MKYYFRMTKRSSKGIVIMIIVFLVGFVAPAVARYMISVGISSARGKGLLWGILLFIPFTELIGYGYLGLSK